MNEYTLEQAVDDCIDMWDWLRKNPDKDKGDYFEVTGIKYSLRPTFYCAMCEYCEVDCSRCPMWGTEYNPKALHIPCFADKKSYGGWSRSDLIFSPCLDQQLANRRIYATEVLKKALNLKWRIRK